MVNRSQDVVQVDDRRVHPSHGCFEVVFVTKASDPHALLSADDGHLWTESVEHVKRYPLEECVEAERISSAQDWVGERLQGGTMVLIVVYVNPAEEYAVVCSEDGQFADRWAFWKLEACERLGPSSAKLWASASRRLMKAARAQCQEMVLANLEVSEEMQEALAVIETLDEEACWIPFAGYRPPQKNL